VYRVSATARFERKYLLGLHEYHRLRTALPLHVEKDRFTKAQGSGRYLVRSIYYDTRDYRAYYEKEDGAFGRIKLRIRSYTDTPEPDSVISVELKTKSGNSMVKYSTHVTFEDYRAYLKESLWPGKADPVLEEFERLRRSRSLLPVVLVQYHREGYRSRDRLPVRVTVDHEVVSTRARSLFPDHAILRPHRPKHVIFEVKTSVEEPEWLTDLVREHELKATSNSKYVQGIEVIRPNMVTPRMVAP